MKTPFTVVLLAALAVPIPIALTSCVMQPSFSANVTAADGTALEIPLDLAKLVVEDGPIHIVLFHYVPRKLDDESRAIVMNYEIHFDGAARPTSIAVDDVTENPTFRVFNDDQPKLDKAGRWFGVSTPKHVDDGQYKWFLTLDTSIRVYRFTVQLADGTTHVLHYPTVVPPEFKEFMRSELKVNGG